MRHSLEGLRLPLGLSFHVHEHHLIGFQRVVGQAAGRDEKTIAQPDADIAGGALVETVADRLSGRLGQGGAKVGLVHGALLMRSGGCWSRLRDSAATGLRAWPGTRPAR